jgi:phenylacetate-coenzyme A ligase PaaK-like adenylate-forming protein
VQNNAAALQAASVPFKAGVKVPGSTSGTNGSRLDFYQSHLATIASDCQYERMLEVHAIDRTAHLARIRVDRSAPYPDGREAEGWSLSYPTSRLSALNVLTPIAEQAEWLLRRRPKYLTTYPSNAAALALRLQATGQSLPLSAVLTIGEQVTVEQRNIIARIFGCRMFDSYGATEAGYLAFECPAGAGYHIAFESVLIDVVDENGRTVPPGTLGQVVVTPIYNYAMPFIRYTIGDYAIAADGACLCGRTLPRLASIAGRVRNVLTFFDGSQRSPWGWTSTFQPLLRSEQMQITQTAMDKIEIRYVPMAGAAPPDDARVEETGRRVFHPNVKVHAVAVDHIARSASGKIEDCISLVTPPLR